MHLRPLLLVGDVLCRNGSDSPGHPAVGPAAQHRGAQRFCADAATDASLDVSDDPAAPGAARHTRDARFRYRDRDGVNHDFRVSWQPGCRVNLPSQSLRFPLGKEGRWREPLGCLKLLGRVFSGCDNGGVGGSIRAGCLVYGHVGGASVMTPSPQ